MQPMLDALNRAKRDRELSWMADRHDTLAEVDESAALSDTPGDQPVRLAVQANTYSQQTACCQMTEPGG
jgi:hypothetical protein